MSTPSLTPTNASYMPSTSTSTPQSHSLPSNPALPSVAHAALASQPSVSSPSLLGRAGLGYPSQPSALAATSAASSSANAMQSVSASNSVQKPSWESRIMKMCFQIASEQIQLQSAENPHKSFMSSPFGWLMVSLGLRLAGIVDLDEKKAILAKYDIAPEEEAEFILALQKMLRELTAEKGGSEIPCRAITVPMVVGNKINQTYTNQVQHSLNADVYTPTPTAAYLNERVSLRTGGMIKEIFKDSELSKLKKNDLLLMTLLYFQASWEKQFDKIETSPGTFYCSDGTSTSVQMMRQTNSKLRIHQHDGFTILGIPYQVPHRSQAPVFLWIIMPDDPKHPLTIPDKMETYQADACTIEGNLSIPRLSISSRSQSAETGLTLMLAIEFIMDEQGSRAAVRSMAVAKGMLDDDKSRIPDFIINRPYYALLQWGNVALFSGAIQDASGMVPAEPSPAEAASSAQAQPMTRSFPTSKESKLTPSARQSYLETAEPKTLMSEFSSHVQEHSIKEITRFDFVDPAFNITIINCTDGSFSINGLIRLLVNGKPALRARDTPIRFSTDDCTMIALQVKEKRFLVMKDRDVARIEYLDITDPHKASWISKAVFLESCQ